jgi:hypothetical protein
MKPNIYFANDDHQANFKHLMFMYRLKPGQDLEYESNIYISSHPDIYNCFNLNQLNLKSPPAWSLLDENEREKHKFYSLTGSTNYLLQLAMGLYDSSEIRLSTVFGSVVRQDIFNTLIQAFCIRGNKHHQLYSFRDNQTIIKPDSQEDIRESVALAYQAVTMTSPQEDILGLLSHQGIKRALEILVVVKQSPTPVKNINKFIEKCINENWSPSTVPIKQQRKVSRIPAKKKDKPELGPQQETQHQPVPFYDWLSTDD